MRGWLQVGVMPGGKGILSLVGSLLSMAWRAASLAGDNIAGELASLRELVTLARSTLASGDYTAALGYIDAALQRLRELQEQLPSRAGWISGKLEVLLGQALSLLEQARESTARAAREPGRVQSVSNPLGFPAAEANQGPE